MICDKEWHDQAMTNPKCESTRWKKAQQEEGNRHRVLENAASVHSRHSKHLPHIRTCIGTLFQGGSHQTRLSLCLGAAYRVKDYRVK